ncbi:MAG: ribonuclease H-like YkuK family protein [Armatimonadota bacterium]|nr:ribonuclease H-like YkuK family protein [Armatimonadota bacterium]MDR5702888.1 ribonuclease H-like YkuK family protein [Armatimonadota bacterium]MDR7434795.1 ribonuclease H-like YkuK family protein [Armatimonadota bacterium]
MRPEVYLGRVKEQRAMEFISPTYGKLSFERMFRQIVRYIQEDPDRQYHLIIGTDSLLGDETTFVTAVIIHRLGRGGRYFYRKFRNRKIESLRQRILYEASLSLEVASQISSELAKNGFSDLPVEIHLDVGNNGETKKIIREVVGMVTGSGYAAVIKPEAYGASKVADKHSK